MAARFADVTRISSAALSSGVAGFGRRHGAAGVWLPLVGVRGRPRLTYGGRKDGGQAPRMPSRAAGQPPVAHSGQQHFDGQIPAAFARVSADVPGREHDRRPVDVVAVKQRENVGEVLPLRGIDPTRRSAACRRACLDTRSAVRRRRLPWRERVGAPERGRCGGLVSLAGAAALCRLLGFVGYRGQQPLEVLTAGAARSQVRRDARIPLLRRRPQRPARRRRAASPSPGRIPRRADQSARSVQLRPAVHERLEESSA